jgi:hypothetical protein
MKDSKIVIVGNSFSSLLLSTLIKERDVILITNFNFIGGVFNGFKGVNGHFDLGMNYFELYPNIKSDPTKFDLTKRNDFLNHTFLINDFIKKNVTLKKVQDGEVYINGSFYKDYLIFDNLEYLNSLPTINKEKILFEIDLLNDLNHPKNKLKNSHYFESSYETISKELFGEYFYENLLEPFLQKSLNISGKQLPAILHRLAWLPIFYPESVVKSIQGNVYKSIPSFYYPQHSNFSEIINKLKQQVKESKNITVFNDEILSIKNNTVTLKKDKHQINYKKLFWGKNIYELDKLFNQDRVISDKTSILICFISVERKNLVKTFSVLNLVDLSTPIYRITNQSINDNVSKNLKISVEINKKYLRSKFPLLDVFDEVNKFFIDNNIILRSLSTDSIQIMEFDNVLELPTFENYQLFTQIKGKYKTFDFLSPSSSFYSNSINEQIIESIKHSKILNDELSR